MNVKLFSKDELVADCKEIAHLSVPTESGYLNLSDGNISLVSQIGEGVAILDLENGLNKKYSVKHGLLMIEGDIVVIKFGEVSLLE